MTTVKNYFDLSYTLEIIPSEDGGWVIKVKELYGCMTQADRWEDILPLIEDAKKLWLKVTLESGDPIPEPEIVAHHT